MSDPSEPPRKKRRKVDVILKEERMSEEEPVEGHFMDDIGRHFLTGILEDDENPKSDWEDESSCSSCTEEDEDVKSFEGKTGTSWSNNGILFPRQPFTNSEGLLLPIPGQYPYDYFNLLATESFYRLIITATNRNAEELFLKNEKEDARITHWKELTVEEFKIFLGVLYHMGTIRMSRLKDYWKTGRLFNLRCFSSFMGRDRFLLILRALNFSPNPETVNSDKLREIRPLVKHIQETLDSVHNPSRDLVVEGVMQLRKGRLSFNPTLKSKRLFGLHLYMLCEPNGLVLRTVCEREVDNGPTHSENIVKNLLQDYLNKGHSVYTNKMYSSFRLARYLLNQGTYCTGMLNVNQRSSPPEVAKTKLSKGELIQKFKEGVCVMKWKGRKKVLLLSTEHDGSLVDIKLHGGHTIQKPKALLHYNNVMGDTDRVDQFMSFYPGNHKTVTWYLLLAIHFFHTVLFNSYVLYNEYSGQRKTLLDFRLSVIEWLLSPRPPSPAHRQPEPSLSHFPESCPQDARGRKKQRRCRFCTMGGIRRETTIFCSGCPDNPPLCVVPCFRLYHTRGFCKTEPLC